MHVPVLSCAYGVSGYMEIRSSKYRSDRAKGRIAGSIAGVMGLTWNSSLDVTMPGLHASTFVL